MGTLLPDHEMGASVRKVLTHAFKPTHERRHPGGHEYQWHHTAAQPGHDHEQGHARTTGALFGLAQGGDKHHKPHKAQGRTDAGPHKQDRIVYGDSEDLPVNPYILPKKCRLRSADSSSYRARA